MAPFPDRPGTLDSRSPHGLAGGETAWTSLLNPRADWVGIVEALYQPNDDGQAWASSVLESLRGSVSVDAVGGAVLVVLEHDPGRSERAMPFVVGVGHAARFNLSTDVDPLSRELFDALFYSRHLALTHTEAGRQVTAEDRAVLKGMRANWGSADAVGLVAHPEPGVIAFLAWPTRTPRELTKHERAVLSQLTLHLESAHRVRRRPETVVAIVQPDGKILHRERDDLPAAAVAERIRGIDRSRTRKLRRCPEALDLWTALVDGELSVVERFDGGRRCYMLIENAPSTRPGPMVAFAPTVVPRQTRVTSVSSVTSEVSSPLSSGFPARGKRSLVKTVCADSITKSSITTPAHT